MYNHVHVLYYKWVEQKNFLSKQNFQRHGTLYCISLQIDVKMAQIQQFIRSLATANPQQQEQLLQRVPLQKRVQVLMRAPQIRQQMQQQQQQQQQGYNPGEEE